MKKINVKSAIYKGLRISNDINAIRRGKIDKRIGRRIAGKASGKTMRKFFK